MSNAKRERIARTAKPQLKRQDSIRKNFKLSELLSKFKPKEAFNDPQNFTSQLSIIKDIIRDQNSKFDDPSSPTASPMNRSLTKSKPIIIYFKLL